MKRSVISLFIICALLSLPFTAFAADSTITFRDSAGIDAAPGSSYSETDLFDNFKNCLPGDTLTEEITLKNEGEEYDFINVYIKALPHDEIENPLSNGVSATGETIASMEDFLSQLHMSVYNGDKLIYSASPNETDGFTNNVFLATIKAGEATDLSVELSVPEDLSNEYAFRTGEVDWVFTSEAYYNIIIDDLIQTGQLNWPIPVLLSIGGVLMLCGLIIIIRKNNKETA